MRKDQSGHLIMSIVSMGQLWSESAPHCESQQNNGERPLWPAHQHHCPQKNPPACEHVSDLMLQESPLTLRGICNCVSFTEEQKSTGTLLPRVHTLVAPQEWGKCVLCFTFSWKPTLRLAFEWRELIWEVIPRSTGRGWRGKPKQSVLIDSYCCGSWGLILLRTSGCIQSFCSLGARHLGYRVTNLSLPLAKGCFSSQALPPLVFV